MLFPGKSDRDCSKNPLQVSGVDYIIDSVNPLTWIDAVRTIKEFGPEKIVMPWWVAFWAPHFWSIITMVKKNLAPEIVFVCHNVFEHEPNFIKKIATKVVLSKADRIITHSKEETLKVKNLLGGDVNTITAFHPTYTDLNESRITRESARKTLELSGNVLLFFGFVRPYKGLSVLLDAMPTILKAKEVTLLVVGEFWKDKQKYIDTINNSGISAKVRIIDRYVPNEEIGLYFAASDLVIQPYISVSGSGISQIAYGFDRPVIATNVGSLTEVVEDGINGRTVEAGNAQALADAILDSLEPEILQRFSLNATETKKKFSWIKMAEIVSGGQQ
jgi:glycosyltransferase involved in cell wall biosynthesis